MPQPTSARSARRDPPRLPRVSLWLLGVLLPTAERTEVMEELADELADRSARNGVVRARLWLGGQLLRSLPALLRRSWWRGMSGFEPEASRLTPGGFFMEAWIIDFRYAARRLRSRPTYALLAVLTLALGVGGTAAIYAVMRGLLLSPLPYDDEHELVRFWMTYSWSEEEFVYLRDRFPGFERVAAYRPDDVTLRGSDGRARFAGGLASSAELFEVLGTRPAIGPGFTAGNDVPGAADEVILSDGLWRELGGTPSLVGSRLDIDGVQRTVVGVMPEGFWFPDPSVRLWLTTGLRPDNGAGNYTFVGRMAPGLSLEQMNAPLRRLSTMLDERFDYPPQWDPTVNPELTSIRTALLGEVRPPLLATLAAMGAILLIACANVAALMLGQSDSRASEFAVRTALGAGFRRIARQLIAEALLLGLAAGAAGALVAGAGLSTLTNALPLGSLAGTVSLEWTLVLHATVIALAAALAISIWPAVALWRGNVRGALSASRTSGVQSGGRLEGAMVTAQITLAVVLCVGAALVTRSVANLTSISTGVTAEGTGVVDFTLPSSESPAERRQAIAEISRAVAALAGVQSAGATHKLPLRGPGSNTGLEIEGRPEISGVTTFFRIVTPDYLPTLGVPLAEGQHFDGSEAANGEPAIVVNAEFVRRYFADEPPIGRRVSTGFGAMGRVVGVVENVAEGTLTDSVTPARYVLYSQLSFIPEGSTLVFRAARPAELPSLLEAVRREVQRIAPGAAVQEVTTMERVEALAIGAALQIRTLLGLLSALALVLGAIGVYGVMSHYVARRAREWAIRTALGLSPWRLIGGVLSRAMAFVVPGVLVGALAAVALGRLLTAFLYGVQTTDALALTAAMVILVVMGALAAAIPAYRASRTDPALALRES